MTSNITRHSPCLHRPTALAPTGMCPGRYIRNICVTLQGSPLVRGTTSRAPSRKRASAGAYVRHSHFWKIIGGGVTSQSTTRSFASLLHEGQFASDISIPLKWTESWKDLEGKSLLDIGSIEGCECASVIDRITIDAFSKPICR